MIIASTGKKNNGLHEAVRKFPSAHCISIIYFGTYSFRRVEVLGDHLSFDHNVFFP